MAVTSGASVEQLLGDEAESLLGYEAGGISRGHDVVRLCVDGLTNRQIGERLFISRRTVQTHLSHAFAKLDVISRVELAAAAARRGGTATGSPARPATAG